MKPDVTDISHTFDIGIDGWSHTCQTGFFEAEDFGYFLVEPALDLGAGDIGLICLPLDSIAVKSDVSVV